MSVLLKPNNQLDLLHTLINIAKEFTRMESYQNEEISELFVAKQYLFCSVSLCQHTLAIIWLKSISRLRRSFSSPCIMKYDWYKLQDFLYWPHFCDVFVAISKYYIPWCVFDFGKQFPKFQFNKSWAMKDWLPGFPGLTFLPASF